MQESWNATFMIVSKSRHENFATKSCLENVGGGQSNKV